MAGYLSNGVLAPVHPTTPLDVRTPDVIVLVNSEHPEIITGQSETDKWPKHETANHRKMFFNIDLTDTADQQLPTKWWIPKIG